jgi:hypothetical protein
MNWIGWNWNYCDSWGGREVDCWEIEKAAVFTVDIRGVFPIIMVIRIYMEMWNKTGA